MSSCETFVKRFHRVSFSKEGFTDCPVVFLEAWQATRPLVSGKPAGEYTPPSTHRLFYFYRGRVSAKSNRLGASGASFSAHPPSSALRKTPAT